MGIREIYHKFWDWSENSASDHERPVDEDITFLENLQYGPDAKNNRFDVFFPNISCKRPTIFYLHGGGYITGQKETRYKFCQRLAKNGYTVFNIEYTKCDDEQKKYFPDQVAEFFEFYNSIVKNEELCNLIGFDNVFLAGDSSGGHIATLVANIQANPNLKFDYNLTGGPKIKGLVLLSSAMSITKLPEPLKSIYANIIFGKKETRNPLSKLTNNVDLATDLLPPILMISSKIDPVVGLQEKKFVKMAKKQNLSLHQYVICKGEKLGHDCVILRSEKYPKTIEAIVNFVNNATHGKFVNGVVIENIFEKNQKPKKSKIKQEEQETQIEAV